jgi:hypothetical protein
VIETVALVGDQSLQLVPRISRAVLEGSGSDAAEHVRAFHSTEAFSIHATGS